MLCILAENQNKRINLKGEQKNLSPYASAEKVNTYRSTIFKGWGKGEKMNAKRGSFKLANDVPAIFWNINCNTVPSDFQLGNSAA